MKITIECTDKVLELNGVQVRIWEGETASGIRVHCFVAIVAVHKDEDQTEFLRELEEKRAPSRTIDVYPARMVL